ncbi:MAG: branched-chain amino acid transporter [SAR116 cluster bacterium]|nr:branched-chain amino acid transporter [SAR116 cluster bacterium]
MVDPDRRYRRRYHGGDGRPLLATRLNRGRGSRMIELWIAILLAFAGTFCWRFLGVIIGDRLPQESLVSVWVNAVAYAMVSGVMMLIVVFPSGLVASSSLTSRLVALFLALVVMLWCRNMLMAALAGLCGFIAVTYFIA